MTLKYDYCKLEKLFSNSTFLEKKCIESAYGVLPTMSSSKRYV